MRTSVRLVHVSISLLPLLALACAPASPAPRAPRELVVFAASSLTDPLAELGPLFGAANAATVTYSFGGTPQLRTQLEHGAHADVFVSANQAQMDAAVKSGVIAGEAPIVAQNRLVAISPRGGSAKLERLEDLGRPGLKLLITQRDVPVGQYTREALRRMAADARFGAGFDARVLANVVSEESNVKQLVAKVQLGEADAAVVYASDVSARVAADVTTIAIPDAFNVVADYPAAVVKGAGEPALAQAYLAYLLSESGRAVIRKSGFLTPDRTAQGQIIPRA